MNSSARLNSAVFQLTPTRTRFDLVITVNGKKEKIASGLLNPFLSHLKAAQDQVAKGGYSIVLAPEEGRNASWFTRGTVERFVRFVSTPEILERVYTIESEILQIEEAIAIQGNNFIGNSIVEENQRKQVESNESTFERKSRKAQQDTITNEEKSIVLYQSDAQPHEANGSTKSEGNSKVQLLKVLETRKSVLQKEQGMAFARAVAAGFDIDYMPALMSFAECFEASRLMDACRNFMSLGKRKHESGQWLEIEAAEVTPNHADSSAVNASGIMLSNMVIDSHTELDSKSNGKTNSDVFSMDRQPTAGYQDNIQDPFPYHGFSPWPVHSPPGALPMFQPYPVQGIPYYQNYPGNSPFIQPVCTAMEDPRLNAGEGIGHRRHSMESRHNYTEPETLDLVDMEREGPHTGERRKNVGRSHRQKSGVVVIRNINYITKTGRTSGSGSYSDSASETDEDKGTHESVKTSKRKASKKSLKRSNASDNEEINREKDADGGHWQAFQNCLLRGVDEDRRAIDQGQFDPEKFDHVRRKKHVAANDNLLLSRRTGQSGNSMSVDDIQSLETDGRAHYRRAANDDFIVFKQESQSGILHPSSNMAGVNGQGYLGKKSFHDVNDDSYIVEYRSVRDNDSGNNERNAIDMNSEFPKVHAKEGKFSHYQPDELRLIPERRAEKGSKSYDPVSDYDMLAQAGIGASQDEKNKQMLARTKPGSKILDKDQKSKSSANSSDKKKTVGPIRRGKSNKLSPLDEARARAERLRNYKADLQRMKKEKEEEEIKRLDSLKMERQKRIASRSSSITNKSRMPSQLAKKNFPTKISPSFYKGSKFSDSEPRSSSPFRRFPIRTASVGSNDSLKASKASRLNKFTDSEPGSSSPFQRFPIRTSSVGSNGSLKGSKTSRLSTGSQSATNKLSRSVPSLRESKEKSGGIADTKASMARIRRLSEPKLSTIRQTSSVKPRDSRTVSVTKATDETKIRKISAIVNHDRSMTATLPELKIRTPKATDTVQNKSSIKEKTRNLNGNNYKSSMNSAGTLPKKKDIRVSPTDDVDDNPIIEKTVVLLECEKPCASNINDNKLKERTGISQRQFDNDKAMDRTKTVPSHVAVRAPVSVDLETSKKQSHVQPMSTKVKVSHTEKEPSKSSSIHIAEETYHAPDARVSSLEDRCIRNSEYAKAPPTSLENPSLGMETFRAHVSDSRNSTLEKIPEVEKPLGKESSKGLRRLLKFGRKNPNSDTAGRNMEPDKTGFDASEANVTGANGSSNEVHTLKHLISRDETPTTSTTPQKPSRSFSLLSPFKSNSREKKVMMA